MDLHVTWEKWPGTNVTYLVEYRVYQSGDPFTVFGTVTTNYVDIPALPKNFYEIRVKADCAEGESGYIYAIGGEDPCEPIVVGNYSIVSNTDTEQKVNLVFSNVLEEGARLKVTNTNNNTVILDVALPYTPGSQSYVVTLPKIDGQTTVYRIEVAQQCPVLNWQLVNDFSIVGAPAKILTTFRYAEDFCAPAPYNNPESCDKPTAGIRVSFSEPLPQSIKIVFDYCIVDCGNQHTTACGSTRAPILGGPAYQEITIPAGVTNYGACFWRDGGDLCHSITWCVVKVIPAVLNNGKIIKFDNTNTCYPIKNIPTRNIDGFKNCQYSS